MGITTSSPTSTSGFTTSDGWAVKVTHMFVNVSAIAVASADGVGAAGATAQVVDEAAAGPQPLLVATVRTARAWENVSFEIGPAAVVADVGPTAVGDVTQDDIDALVKDGVSISLEGSATRGADTKTFTWRFTTDTVYSDCTGDVDGASRPGLLVPSGGDDTADVVLSSSALFADDTGALHFDAIAAADADKNGEVTLDELAATDLGDATTARTRTIVSSFRAKGHCTAAAVEQN